MQLGIRNSLNKLKTHCKIDKIKWIFKWKKWFSPSFPPDCHYWGIMGQLRAPPEYQGVMEKNFVKNWKGSSMNDVIQFWTFVWPLLPHRHAIYYWGPSTVVTKALTPHPWRHLWTNPKPLTKSFYILLKSLD